MIEPDYSPPEQAAEKPAPSYQETVSQTLLVLERQFNDGDKQAIFRAIDVCSEHGLPLPDWVNEQTGLHRYLIDYEGSFNNGDKQALLEAISFCAEYNLPMPLWVRYHFNMSYRKYLNLEADTLDDAFQVFRKKPSSRDKKWQKKAIDVGRAVVNAKRYGVYITSILYEKIAEDFAANSNDDDFNFNRSDVADMSEWYKKTRLGKLDFEGAEQQSKLAKAIVTAVVEAQIKNKRLSPKLFEQIATELNCGLAGEQVSEIYNTHLKLKG